MNTTLYPFTRSDECSWQPEEAARRLSSLRPTITSNYNTGNSTNNIRNDGGYDPIRNDISNDTDPLTVTQPNNRSNLLTRGRNSMEVRGLRNAFGSNTLHGDDVDDSSNFSSSSSVIQVIKRNLSVVKPIVHAFYDQLKEPLILMLLFSAGISLFLGNSADSISIALALSIVSLVAAVQEYRSEKGECLYSLCMCISYTNLMYFIFAIPFLTLILSCNTTTKQPLRSLLNLHHPHALYCVMEEHMIISQPKNS